MNAEQRKAFSLVKSLILNRSVTLTLKSSFVVTGFIASSPELVAVNPAFGHSGLPVFCLAAAKVDGCFQQSVLAFLLQER